MRTLLYLIVVVCVLLQRFTEGKLSCSPVEERGDGLLTCHVVNMRRSYDNDENKFWFGIRLNSLETVYPNCWFTEIWNLCSLNYSALAVTVERLAGIFRFDVTVKDLKRAERHSLCITVGNPTQYETSCTYLEFYAKPDDVKCIGSDLKAGSDAVVVTCRTERIFPQALCLINRLYESRPDVSITRTLYETQSYLQKVGSTSLLYFRSNCSMTFPLTSLGQGRHRLEVTVYPNLTAGESKGVRIAVDQLYDLSFPSAELLPSCGIEDLYYKANETIECVCVRSREGSPAGRVQWFHQGQPLDTGNDNPFSSTLAVRYSEVDQDFECCGVSALGKQTMCAIYKPRFERPSGIISFTGNQQTNRLQVEVGQSVTLRCHVEGNPPPRVVIYSTRLRTPKRVADRARVVEYNLPRFACEDVDEYVCTADNGVRTNTTTDTSRGMFVFAKCPPELDDLSLDNQSFTTSEDEIVFISVKVTGLVPPGEFTLKFLQQGLFYEVRRHKYTVTYLQDTPLLGRVNLALYDLQAMDFTQYILTISSGPGEGLDFHFRVEDDRVTSRHLAIGFGVCLPLLVLALAAILFCRRRRRCVYCWAGRWRWCGSHVISVSQVDLLDCDMGSGRSSNVKQGAMSRPLIPTPVTSEHEYDKLESTDSGSETTRTQLKTFYVSKPSGKIRYTQVPSSTQKFGAKRPYF
ncbi:uncharacterized protein LOC131930536 [Physella acuta]|uniref:uncharacterized protein LOC131930536 n=1 Tax=Physella acuta TaxID=109671 RepID=UPI0027DDD0CE|nr:uncharacterized protein LOC131930536 [Physella acuta]